MPYRAPRATFKRFITIKVKFIFNASYISTLFTAIPCYNFQPFFQGIRRNAFYYCIQRHHPDFPHVLVLIVQNCKPLLYVNFQPFNPPLLKNKALLMQHHLLGKRNLCLFFNYLYMHFNTLISKYKMKCAFIYQSNLRQEVERRIILCKSSVT